MTVQFLRVIISTEHIEREKHMSHIKKLTVTVKYHQEDQNRTHLESMWGAYSTDPVNVYHIACSESHAQSAVENYKNAGSDDLVDFCGVLIVERCHVLSVLVENHEGELQSGK